VRITGQKVFVANASRTNFSGAMTTQGVAQGIAAMPGSGKR
jgi:hypothetical protein